MQQSTLPSLVDRNEFCLICGQIRLVSANHHDVKRPQPILSVCIPTYRGAAHLGATIDSVLSQSFDDFELIVIDDNSPDDTLGIVARYKDPRVRYMRNANNLGPEGNWNRCLSESRVKYFKLVSQDDLLMSGCLERQIAVLERDTEETIALAYRAYWKFKPSFSLPRTVSPHQRVVKRTSLW